MDNVLSGNPRNSRKQTKSALLAYKFYNFLDWKLMFEFEYDFSNLL